MSESDTPRTDDALRATMAETGRLGPEHAALTYLARQLEQELAEARKERQQWKAQYWAMCDRYDALDLKLDAAMASDPPAAEKG